MKSKLQYAEALLLGLFAAYSAVGCLVSAFELPIQAPMRILGIWALACAASLLLLPRKRGGLLLLLLTAAGCWLWWRNGSLREQTLSLVNRILDAYDQAYGFGVPNSIGLMWFGVEDALAVLGAVVIESVCAAVLRGHSSWLATGLLIGHLALCLVVTDTIPSVPTLFGLLLCLGLLVLTDGTRSAKDTQASKLFFAGLIPLILGLALVFWLNPRENYVNRAKPIQQSILNYFSTLPDKLRDSELLQSYLNRKSSQVELSEISSQPQLNLPVAELAVGQAGTVYLRQRDYDVYTGTAWQSTEGRQENLSGTGASLGAVVVRELVVQGGSLLPAYPDGSFLLYDGTAQSPDGEKVFHVERRQSAFGGTPDARWLQLPEYTAEQMAAILRRIPGDLTTPASAAAAIGAYVSSLAPYDRDVETMPEDQQDFALWFLTAADRGYCVHFASTAAVLLRASGVPARYVTGYKVEAEPGTTVRVTSNEAHAWVEYYDADTWAWSILEATPGDPDSAPLELQETTAPTEATEPAATQPTQPTQPPQTQPTETVPAPTEIEKTEPQREFPRWIPLSLVGGMLLVLLAELQRNLRIRLRRRRQQSGTANRRALLRWQEITLQLRLLRTPAPESLTALAEKAMFSQHTLDKQELSRLTDFASHSRRKLRKAKWWKRIVYRYWFALI